MELLTNIKPD